MPDWIFLIIPRWMPNEYCLLYPGEGCPMGYLLLYPGEGCPMGYFFIILRRVDA